MAKSISNKKLAGVVLGLLGGGFVVNELTKSASDRSANLIGSLKSGLDLTDAGAIAKLIEGSPELQEYLKKIVGAKTENLYRTVNVAQGRNILFGAVVPDNGNGADSDLYINTSTGYLYERIAGVWTFKVNLKGANGSDGLNNPTYSNSLVINGAGELSDATNLGSIVQNGTTEQGMRVLKAIASSYFVNKFNIDKKSLYKISFRGKTNAGSFYPVLLNYDIDDNILQYLGSNKNTYLTTFNNTVFENKTVYVGGTGVSNQNFLTNTAKCRVGFVLFSGATEVLFSDLIVEKVLLSEPVPHNLSWLPTNQEVLNSTTGQRGYWNGTAFVYYT